MCVRGWGALVRRAGPGGSTVSAIIHIQSGNKEVSLALPPSGWFGNHRGRPGHFLRRLIQDNPESRQRLAVRKAKPI